MFYGVPHFMYMEFCYIMDFGHHGYEVLCCGGLLDGFNNCAIICPQHNLSYDFVKNIINEMDETKVDKDRAKKLPSCVRV